MRRAMEVAVGFEDTSRRVSFCRFSWRGTAWTFLCSNTCQDLLQCTCFGLVVISRLGSREPFAFVPSVGRFVWDLYIARLASVSFAVLLKFAAPLCLCRSWCYVVLPFVRSHGQRWASGKERGGFRVDSDAGQEQTHAWPDL